MMMSYWSHLLNAPYHAVLLSFTTATVSEPFDSTSYLMYQQLKLHPLCSCLQDVIWQIAEVFHHSGPQEEKKKIHTKLGNSARPPEPLDPSEHRGAFSQEARISLQ